MNRSRVLYVTLTIQSLITVMLVIGWLVLRDPTFAIAYPVACSPDASQVTGDCNRLKPLVREYFRLYPDEGRVVAWEDRPFTRARTYGDCAINAPGDWNCPVDDGHGRLGIRDGLGFRQGTVDNFAGRRYVGPIAWWSLWLRDWLPGKS